jgi:hypothetical protein
MADTKKYIVTEKHALGHKVGDTIELTDANALKLVNKIKLAPVIEKPVEEVKPVSPVKKEKKTKKAAK